MFIEKAELMKVNQDLHWRNSTVRPEDEYYINRRINDVDWNNLTVAVEKRSLKEGSGVRSCLQGESLGGLKCQKRTGWTGRGHGMLE